MSDTVPTSRLGTQFGPYRLRRLLGCGGMGEVYEAHDTVKDRTVALKLMSLQFSADDVFRRRMAREAHTAGRLQEPHIVPIHDYGEIGGQLFIDMRFVEGIDLGALLSRNGALPPPRAVAIVGQIAAALDAAHRAGVIHRDIKPENILITGDDFAYLVDFGIAAAATDQHLTKTGAAVGSWSYMAPERFGDHDITYRSDIYALACVLYECLTGTRPYQTRDLSSLMGAHLTRPIPRPSLQRPGVPTAFDEVIARGMAKAPDERYTTAGDLARAARQALSAADQERAAAMLAHSQHAAPPPSGPMPQPLPLPPQPPAWRPPPTAKRKPWLIAGAVLTVVAVVAGTGIWLAAGKVGDERPGSQSTATTTSVAPATTTATPKLTTAQLDSLLLSPEQINTIVGATGFVVDHNATEMTDPGPGNTLSDEQCLGALIGFQTRTYKSSGYTGMLAQLVEKPHTNPGYIVVQGGVIFASADQARGFVAAQAAQWRNCAGRIVTQTNSGKTLQWAFREVTGDPPTISLQRDPVSGVKDVACQHTISAVSNVVLDVNVCAPQTTDQASQIAAAMAAKMPKQ